MLNFLLDYQGDIPVTTPLSLDTTDFNLFVIKNDHCYTPLTSPSQKLPEEIDNSANKSISLETKKLSQPEHPKTPAKEIKRSLYNAKVCKSGENQNENLSNKSVVSLASRKVQNIRGDLVSDDLQSLSEDKDDFDSEHIPSSESVSSDDASDEDFNINERKSVRLRKGAKGLNKTSNLMRNKSFKKLNRRKSTASAQHLEVESMLHAMEGENINLGKPMTRRYSVNIGKTAVKSVGEKKVKKPVKVTKVYKTEKDSPPPDIPKSGSIETVLVEVQKPNDEPKVSLKIQSKKDKKPPARVTEALFSDMTSLFSTPDIIKKVPTPPGRLSVDQRKSVDSSSEITGMAIKATDKVEKRKQSKDSEGFNDITPKENTFSLCDTTENNPKHLDFIDKFINGTAGFPDQNSSLSDPPINSLPSLVSILQATDSTDAETNIDEAALLNNVVGVNLLDTASKVPNALEAVSIQALTNSDIPDSGPLSAVSTGSLDLEENTLLESLHNVGEDISEDFLMHITQTLVENSEIKAVIDKQLENPTPIEQSIPVTPPIVPKPKPIESPFVKLAQAKLASKEAAMAKKEPIQIVRSDGRIITLPPIEAPATRSKRKAIATSSSNNLTTQTKPANPFETKGNSLQSNKKSDTISVVKKSPLDVSKKRARSNSIQKNIIQHSLHDSEDDDDEDSDAESWRSEDDPDRYCIHYNYPLIF